MTAKQLLKTVLSSPVRRWLRNQQRRLQRLFPPRLRTAPVSADWGWSRGQPIDRYYIERFLAEHADDVRGHVLDFADDTYARRFGSKATQVDVLHRLDGNPHATIVADLARGEQIPSNTFDCILCTQVLQYIYDLPAAIRTLYRILKPGGIILVTAPGIQKIDLEGMEAWGECWRFTALSLHRLFEEAFSKGQVEVRAYGNVLVAAAALYGYAWEDVRRDDLEYQDPEYEVLITLRARKLAEVSTHDE
jgi:SAM-dependent methyltransferase